MVGIKRDVDFERLMIREGLGFLSVVEVKVKVEVEGVG